MEKLLNELIKRGWQPFGGPYYDRFIIESNGDMCFRWKYLHAKGESAFDYNYDYFRIRELVSKESGLWQFCMSKGFTPNVSCYRWEKWLYDIDDLNQCEADVSGFDNYGYRIIESSLIDEDKLEKFLLDNIKVDGIGDKAANKITDY